MKLETLQKFGGVSLIAGSVLLLVYSVFFSFLLPIKTIRADFTAAVLNPNWLWLASAAFFGVIFLIFGFMSVYSKIHRDSGITGFLGFLLVETAYIIQACKVTWEIFLWPVIAANQVFAPLLRDLIIWHSPLVVLFNSAASITILLGIILFCTALIRSKAFPKFAGILILAGAMLYGFGPLFSVIIAISGITILSLGCFILGIKLIRPVSEQNRAGF